MTTLQDLIQKGVAMHNDKLETEQVLCREEEAKVSRCGVVIEQAILALFPPALHPFITIKFRSSSMLYAEVRMSLPSGGKVRTYVEYTDGKWSVRAGDSYYLRRKIAVYEGFNAAGCCRHFFSLEEAVAFAAGAI